MGALNCQIGGETPDAANVVAFNGGPGVQVAFGSGIWIAGNSIFENSGLGIDLGGAGVTPNDLNDTDIGVNNLQNFPVLTSAVQVSLQTAIAGTFNSHGNENYRLEFFVSPSAVGSGFGEGKVFLGTTNLTTDASGNASFQVTFDGGDTVGQVITATATDAGGNTSEFSNAQPVSPLEPPSIIAQPQPQVLPVGATAIFDVTAIGEGSLAYQWFFNGAPLADGTNHSLQVPNVQPMDAGGYWVRVGNAADYVTSDAVSLTLLASFKWIASYNGPANGNDELNDLAVDPAGNVFVTGLSETTNSAADYLTIKYTATGLPLWTNRYNGPGNGLDAAQSLAVDDAGNAYITGQSLGGNFDYATLKYAPDGTPDWTARLLPTGAFDDDADDVAVDAAGNVYVTGTAGGDYRPVAIVIPPGPAFGWHISMAPRVSAMKPGPWWWILPAMSMSPAVPPG